MKVKVTNITKLKSNLSLNMKADFQHSRTFYSHVIAIFWSPYLKEIGDIQMLMILNLALQMFLMKFILYPNQTVCILG